MLAHSCARLNLGNVELGRAADPNCIDLGVVNGLHCVASEMGHIVLLSSLLSLRNGWVGDDDRLSFDQLAKASRCTRPTDTAGSNNANPHNIIVLHGEALHPELVLGPGHDDRAPEGCRSEAR